MTSPLPPRWSDPEAAFAEYRPGQSAYLHYFYDLRTSRDDKLQRPDLDSEAGAELPWQLEKALRKMIEESLG